LSVSKETGWESLDSHHKQLPLTSEGDELLALATRTEVWSDFVEGRTETLRGAKGTKAECEVVALFNSAMVLFDAAVEVSTVPVLHVRAQDFPNRPRIGVMTIGGDLLWSLSL
jgi:hypothetical protein